MVPKPKMALWEKVQKKKKMTENHRDGPINVKVPETCGTSSPQSSVQVLERDRPATLCPRRASVVRLRFYRCATPQSRRRTLRTAARVGAHRGIASLNDRSGSPAMGSAARDRRPSIDPGPAAPGRVFRPTTIGCGAFASQERGPSR